MMRRALLLSLSAFTFACQPEVEADETWTPTEMSGPPAPATLDLDVASSALIGGSATVVVTGATQGELVRVFAGDNFVAPYSPNGLGGQSVELGAARIVGRARADANGRAVINVPINNRFQPGDEVLLQAAIFRGQGGVASVVSDVERVRGSDGSARLRVVHACADAPAVDIYANGGLLLAGVPYQASSGYLSVPAGNYDIDIRAAGASPASPPVYSASLTLSGLTDYTALAVGSLASANPADAFRVLALVDEWGSVAPGTFRTRIVHASPDAPAVDIDVGNDGSSEIFGLNRFADTGAGGVALPAGVNLQVGVIAGGSIPFTVPGMADTEELTVVATGFAADRPNEDGAFGLLALGRDGLVAFVRQNPTVYALHASPGAPAVDVLVGGSPIIEDLPFREISAPVSVPPGVYNLDIYDETQSVFVGSFATPALAAGERYVVIAAGLVGGSPSFALFPIADQQVLNTTDPLVTVFHGSPDAPPVQAGAILAGSFVDLTGTIAFGDVAGEDGVTVPPGTYELAVALPAGPVAFSFPGVALNAGDRYLAVATGTLSDFGLTLVDLTAQPFTAATLTP